MAEDEICEAPGASSRETRGMLARASYFFLAEKGSSAEKVSSGESDVTWYVFRGALWLSRHHGEQEQTQENGSGGSCHNQGERW